MTTLFLLRVLGFGGLDDAWPHLNAGDWSKEFGMEPMPFDGFLFASRVFASCPTGSRRPTPHRPSRISLLRQLV
jgi:enoyl reductase-like protein